MKGLSLVRVGLLSWVVLLLFAAPAVALRKPLAPYIGGLGAEMVAAVLVLFVACGTAFWFLHKGWFPSTRAKLYLIGLVWCLASIAADFLCRAGFRQMPWERFDVTGGEFLSFLSLVLVFIPMGVAQRNQLID